MPAAANSNVVTFKVKKGGLFTGLFRAKAEADVHAVEAQVQWHVLSQLVRLPYAQQERIIRNVVAQLEERAQLGLTVEEGQTRVALDYSEAQE